MRSASLPLVLAAGSQRWTRADCADLPRPCPFDRCRHHLGEGAPFSCALDVADMGAHSADEVAVILGIPREGVRDIEAEALRKLRARLGRQGFRAVVRGSDEAP